MIKQLARYEAPCPKCGEITWWYQMGEAIGGPYRYEFECVCGNER